MRSTLSIAISFLLCAASAQEAAVNTGNMHVHNGANISFFGDVENSGVWNSNSGTIFLAGTSQQTIKGSQAMGTLNLTLNNPAGYILETSITVQGVVQFNDGILLTDRLNSSSIFLRFTTGASHTGSDDDSHVDGFVRKVGNSAFDFPVGYMDQIQRISMSAPSDPNQEFEATYLEVDPSGVGNTTLLDPTIDHISDCEYWLLNPTVGSSALTLSLEYDAHSCGVGSQASLLVGHWDGSIWKDRGNTLTTGNLTAGTISSISFIPGGPISLGSADNLNVLPVELLYFTADIIDEEVWLLWHTESESNNSHFVVERSLDAENWETVGTLPGAGNSNVGVDYRLQDLEPFVGMSYYRLKQVDFNGQFNYSHIETIFFAPVLSSSIYPNPTSAMLFVHLNAQASSPTIRVFNSVGQQVPVVASKLSGALFQINTSNLSAGSYIVQVTGPNRVETHELIIQ